MATKKGREFPAWRPKPKLSSDFQLHICGSVVTVNMELLSLKSARIAKLLESSPRGEDLSVSLRDIPADQESFEIVVKFCHGFDINLSVENVVRVACVAHYLGMTENHCLNNLLSKAISFFEKQVLPSWNNSIRALKSAENNLHQASQLNLVDTCIESVLSKAMDDPRLLGEPIKTSISDENCDDNNDTYRSYPRRKLFDLDWKSEDLTELSLVLYGLIVQELIRRKVPEPYITANLCQYAKKWIFCVENKHDMSSNKRDSQREIVEVLERLIPDQKGIVPCTFLFEMLRSSIALEANNECKNGLEMRIGKQLDEASVSDLLISSRGYTIDEPYDTDFLRRILKNFYCSYTGPDVSGLHRVAELMDKILVEISSDTNLNTSTFIAVADMSIAASTGTERTSDGIYLAIDIYLDKHRDLTESEREEVCKVLDCNKMSAEACEHAAQNERLPLRAVVQVLFVRQLMLRDTIVKEVQASNASFRKQGDEEEMAEKQELHEMRGETERVEYAKVRKPSLWREMKRKLGCVTSMDDCGCHVKKKKKKK